MKKLILFDWGNVVEAHTTGYNLRMALDDLFHKCGYTGTESVLSLIGKYYLYCIKTEDEFIKVYEDLKRDFNLNTDYNEFVKLYRLICNKIDYYKDVADYEVSLKNRCNIGLLSELLLFDKDRLNKEVGLDNYDYVFLSCEYGMNKKKIEFFNKIQEELPFEPSNILFVDDREDNCDKAASIGWNVCCANGLELDKIKEACEYFLNS